MVSMHEKVHFRWAYKPSNRHTSKELLFILILTKLGTSHISHSASNKWAFVFLIRYSR